MNRMTLRWTLALLVMAMVGHVAGCGGKEAEVDRGDPSSPDYITEPNPEAFGNRYTGSPLDPNPPKKEKKK